MDKLKLVEPHKYSILEALILLKNSTTLKELTINLINKQIAQNISKFSNLEVLRITDLEK